MWEGDKGHGSEGRCSGDLERGGGAGEEGSRELRAGREQGRQGQLRHNPGDRYAE